MKLAIYEILKNASALKSDEDKADYLRQHQSQPLLDILRGAFDPNIEWALPEGAPPYTEANLNENQGMLYTEARKLYLFTKNDSPDLKQTKRELLFINLLESIHPEDAKLLIAMKDKKLPYKNINRAIVNLAFPGLIPDEQVVQA